MKSKAVDRKGLRGKRIPRHEHGLQLSAPCRPLDAPRARVVTIILDS